MSLLNKTKTFLRLPYGFKFIPMFFVLMLLNMNLIAQTNNNTNIEKEPNPRTATISVIARVDTDSVVLRWAPSTAGGWVIANNIGYIVEKLVIEPDKPIQNSDYIKLTAEPIKPLSLEEWKATASPDNMFLAVAAQALYGKSFNPRPLDEGNMNVLKNAADELTNRYSFSLFAADNDAFTANALGLRLVDKDIIKDKKYAYRVYLAEKTDEYTFDTAYIVVDAIPFQKCQPPTGLKYESGDGNIKLLWEERRPYNFSGYYVYRSEDGGQSYQKLNKMPLITITPANAVQEAQPSFIDTSTINYKIYRYRVRGVTSFGELSDAREITAFSKDLNAPPAPTIHKPEQISGSEIKISWEMKNAPDDLKGFIVSRSDNSLHGYQFITQNPLPKSTMEFIDDLSGAYEAYYVVASVDTSGNMTFSLPVLATRIDTIPPAIPKGLTGKISEKGVVTLSWNLGHEQNIAGYRVLRANDPSHEYIQITGQIHPDTVFVDTININTLTRRVFYRIAAVNNRYQHSELSPVLLLTRPDIIPPGEAVFSDVFVTDTSVQLQWYPSPSEDLARQMLLRKIKEEKEWVVIDSLAPAVSFYIDKDIETGIMYEYTIIGIDSSNLSSEPAFPVMARPYDSGKRNPVENFTAEYKQSNKTVTLTWDYTPLEKERTWYVIYKAIGEGSFKEHKAADGAIFTFVDNNVKSGTIKYGIVVMTSHGGESEMVKTLIIIEETE